MNKDTIAQILKTFNDEFQASLLKAQGSLVTAFPDAAPVPEPAPVPLPEPTTTAVGMIYKNPTLQNMSLVNGVYRSNNLSGDGKCYAQIRIPNPVSCAKLTGTRKTNVIPDGTKNIKVLRIWPEVSYPNIYLARGLKEGACKLTIEFGSGSFLNIDYLDIPWQKDVATPEEYIFDFAGKTLSVKIGSFSRTYPGVNYGTNLYTQFGFQCVYAPNTGDSGPLPSGSYVEFGNVQLEVR